jgi:Glycosyltransferase family 9 (heptosyltransferase)
MHLGQGDTALAVLLLSQAVASAGHDAALWTALGVALRFQGRLDDAATALLRALALEPGRADAQVYLGMIRLAQGNQETGWPLYQARWRTPGWPERMRYPLQALWQGRVSAGTRLLLWCEQGLGDTLQFARYAPWLQQMLQTQKAQLVLELPQPLLRLLQHSWPTLEMAALGQVQGRFDAHLPLMDLPNRWGGMGADLLPYQPGAMPYLKLPAPAAQAVAGTPYPALAPRPGAPAALKVGVTWQGRASHADDRLRSLAPEALLPLFEQPGLAWVSLQKDDPRHPAWLPQTLADCQDFWDTAGVLQGLDVVVSIDSAVAHLAAALGKPVLLLLPAVADWRWGLGAPTTPWYPGMRLFRRGLQEDWSDVMPRVAAALRQMAGLPGG